MILGLDFGASRVKSCLLQSLKDNYIHFDSKGSLFFSNKIGIVNKDFFITSLKRHLDFYLKKNLKITKIIICGEMHGFFYSKGKTISNYYSWRCKNKISFDDTLNKKNFISMTGMRPRIEIPYFKIKELKGINEVFGISEFICKKLGKFNNVLHSTYAQSLGLYILKNRKLIINKELSSINKNIKINYGYFNNIGTITYKKKTISIYGGFGDLQCSNKLMAMRKNRLILNLSTGSQLIFKYKSKKNDLDYRISFNKGLYSCITHIPSGRYLIYLAEKLKIPKKKFFNNLGIINISKLNFIEYKHYDLKDLNTNFKKIFKKVSKNEFLEIIIFVYVNQYLKLLKELKFEKLIITGGISFYLGNFISYLKYIFPKQTIEVSYSEDETIKFLLEHKSKLC